MIISHQQKVKIKRPKLVPAATDLGNGETAILSAEEMMSQRVSRIMAVTSRTVLTTKLKAIEGLVALVESVCTGFMTCEYGGPNVVCRRKRLPRRPMRDGLLLQLLAPYHGDDLTSGWRIMFA